DPGRQVTRWPGAIRPGPSGRTDPGVVAAGAGVVGRVARFGPGAAGWSPGGVGVVTRYSLTVRRAGTRHRPGPQGGQDRRGGQAAGGAAGGGGACPVAFGEGDGGLVHNPDAVALLADGAAAGLVVLAVAPRLPPAAQGWVQVDGVAAMAAGRDLGAVSVGEVA